LFLADSTLNQVFRFKLFDSNTGEGQNAKIGEAHIVAGVDTGDCLKCLSKPESILVDDKLTVYITDKDNDRILY
jgi:hypothetical protein